MSVSFDIMLEGMKKSRAAQFDPGVNPQEKLDDRFPKSVTGNATLKSPTASTAPAATEDSVLAAPSRRVLVVDDNRDLAESLAMILRFWGHDVAVAYNGREALEVARSNPPDVVFLDIGLPHLDGFEVARQLRADPELRNVKLIAITGYGREEDRQRSQAVGFDLHLIKPVDPWQLQSLLTGDELS